MTSENSNPINWEKSRESILQVYRSWLEANPPPFVDHLASMETTEELPIAQRKAKRSCSFAFPTPPHQSNGISKTPRRRSKKVRFSDSDGLNLRSNRTGLTPFIARSSLSTPQKQQLSSPISNFPPLIQFTPFREILDDRFKRRIRRNGLSQEMNDYDAERKTVAQLQQEIEKKDRELQHLRAELEASRQSRPEDAPASSQRIDEIETELAQLRQSFSEQSVSNDEDMRIDWAHVQHQPGPTSDGGDTIQIWEDDDASFEQSAAVAPSSSRHTEVEGLAVALELESARNEKARLFAESRNQRQNSSFEMQFEDTPARIYPQSSLSIPDPPSDFYQSVSRSLKATVQRAEEAENALAVLEAEVKSLGFDGPTAYAILGEVIQQFRSARLELERILPGETVVGFENARVLQEILGKLKMVVKMVKDRDAELKSMRDQQRTLKGNFDHAIVASDRANAKVKDLEDALDRNAEEMLHIRMKNQDMEKEIAEKERSIESLIAALGKYRDDVARLEELIEQLQSQQDSKAQEARDEAKRNTAQTVSNLEAKVSAEQRERHAAEQSAVERLATIRELEDLVGETRGQCEQTEAQLVELQTSFSVQQSEHETEIGALNTRISNLSTALASANAEVDKLKVQKAKLEERVKEEIEKAAAATEIMQAQFIKGVVKANDYKNKYLRGAKIRGANWEMENDEETSSSVTGPMTPASIVRFVDVEGEAYDDVEGSVEMSRGKGRRRSRRKYDSGIGMESLSDGDESPGMMTPDLSSEADYGGMVE